MTNPFSHDSTSNAVGDFVKGVMSAPEHSLSEEDYRFPPGQTSAPPRPGHYPQGYAP